MRTKALRRKVWFNALTEQERILTVLMSKNIKIVKNIVLATVIARIIVKLITAIKNSFNKRIEQLGHYIATLWATGAASTGWDNTNWVNDPDIVRWFGTFVYNTKGGCHVRV